MYVHAPGGPKASNRWNPAGFPACGPTAAGVPRLRLISERLHGHIPCGPESFPSPESQVKCRAASVGGRAWRWRNQFTQRHERSAPPLRTQKHKHNHHPAYHLADWNPTVSELSGRASATGCDTDRRHTIPKSGRGAYVRYFTHPKKKAGRGVGGRTEQNAPTRTLV